MADGYMIGAYLQMETTSSEDACARKVKSLLPLANGITYNVGSGECYAEFATGSDESSGYRFCMFGGKYHTNIKISKNLVKCIVRDR